LEIQILELNQEKRKRHTIKMTTKTSISQHSKVFKSKSVTFSNMIPGNLTRLPDESLQQKPYKSSKIINNIQVPGMVFRDNAGLPILSSPLIMLKLGGKK